MSTYRSQAQLVEKYVKEYNKSKIIELQGLKLIEDNVICEGMESYIDIKNKYTYYYSLQTKIDHILDLLDYDEATLLKKEYFSPSKHPNWWLGYYSRSTYYRIKKKALDSFLELLYE